MRTSLRILAALVFCGTLGFWIALGANRGWTKNQVPVKIVDDVTGIEGVRWEKRFVPGVEFLAAGVVVAGILAGGSFLFRAKNTGHDRSV